MVFYIVNVNAADGLQAGDQLRRGDRAIFRNNRNMQPNNRLDREIFVDNNNDLVLTVPNNNPNRRYIDWFIFCNKSQEYVVNSRRLNETNN